MASISACHAEGTYWGSSPPAPALVHSKLTSEDWSRIHKRAYKKGTNYVAGGTTKWFKYRDIKVQGSYELRVCKILDHWKEIGKIKDWYYSKDRIKYKGIDNKSHTYLIDFTIIPNEGEIYFIETKGRKTDNDELKWKAIRDLGFKLEVWFDKEIKEQEILSI